MNTERVDAAELAVTELIANVVRHTPDQYCTVVLRKQRSGLRVEVTDSWPKLPKTVQADELDEGGRGLALLGLVTDAWAAELLPEGEGEGKVVWFEIE